MRSTRDRVSVSALASARNRALTLASDLVRAARTLDRNLNRAKILSKELGFTDLYKRLTSISVPAADDTPETWQVFSQTLLDIFQTHFSLEDYMFTDEQAKPVLNYLKTNGLLQACLQNAYVSD